MDSSPDLNHIHRGSPTATVDRVAVATGGQRTSYPTPPAGRRAVAEATRQEIALQQLLHLARRSREATHRGGCPRCGETRVIRWGGFAGRRRYRCHGCGRTFSDFTCTPVAYAKYAPLWLANAQCIAKGATIRSIAAHLAVSPSTAFRWRHATLGALCRRSTARLAGAAGLKELVLRQSEKGSRSLDRPPYHHIGVPSGPERVIVLFASDISGATAAAVIGRWRTNAEMVVAFLKGRFARGVTVLGDSGTMSPHAAGCVRAGLTYRCGVRRGPGATSVPGEIAAIRRLVAGFRSWMRRFRGVATRYLAHYLRWYRFMVDHGMPPGRKIAGKLLLDAFTGGLRAPLP
jgi:transposase-like protein